MDSFAIHAADLNDLLAEAGGDVPVMWYSGQSIPVMADGASFKESNSPGGLMINADLSLTVLCAYFPAGFNFDGLAKQQFRYPGQQGDLYVVDTVIKSPNLHQIRLLANHAAEGL